MSCVGAPVRSCRDGTLVAMICSPWRRWSTLALPALMSLLAAACGGADPVALEVPTDVAVPSATPPPTTPPQALPATPTPTAAATATAHATSSPTVTAPATPTISSAPTVTRSPTTLPTPTVTSPPTPTLTPTAAPTPGAAAVGYGRQCIVHDRLERCWSIRTSGLDAPRPLVIDLHGWGGSGEQQRVNSRLDEIAAEEYFVAVWPDGLNSSWNAGVECCGSSSAGGVDDVGFLRSLIASVGQAHNVDLDRVYVTGFSNGCAMAQRLAAEASDLVAAVACTSLFRLVPVAPGYSPVPIMALHGSRDSVIPYEPGSFEGAPLGGAVANVESWAALNGCAAEPTEAALDDDKVRHSYLGCAAGAEVVLVTIDDADHNLYIFAEPRTETTRLMWDFLSRFPN